MAIGTESGNIAVTKSDRCWRAELFIDDDTIQNLVFHREIRAKDSTTGDILASDKNSISPVRRTSDQVKTKSYTAGGLTATGLQILQLINKMADDERQYDIDNPPPSRPGMEGRSV